MDGSTTHNPGVRALRAREHNKRVCGGCRERAELARRALSRGTPQRFTAPQTRYAVVGHRDTPRGSQADISNGREGRTFLMGGYNNGYPP